MTDLALDIVLMVMEMEYSQAIKKIISNTSRLRNEFIMVLHNYNEAQSQFNKGVITEEAYSIKKTRVTESISFFLNKLKKEELEKIYQGFSNENKIVVPTAIKIDLIQSPLKLFLVTSTPTNLEQLSTNREFREIEEQIKLSPDPPQVKVINKIYASRFKDLVNTITSDKPDIIHFSGHGVEESLFMENDKGGLIEVKGETLAALFNEFKDFIKCIVLNACFTSAQAQKISQLNLHVIGMNKAIKDEVAIKFAAAFYASLARVLDFKKSFRLACIQLQVSDWDQHTLPECWFNGEMIPGN